MADQQAQRIKKGNKRAMRSCRKLLRIWLKRYTHPVWRQGSMKSLNPGSDEALERGCTCPVLDNGHGRGFPWGDVDPCFWINGRCPLHGTKRQHLSTSDEHLSIEGR